MMRNLLLSGALLLLGVVSAQAATPVDVVRNFVVQGVKDMQLPQEQRLKGATPGTGLCDLINADVDINYIAKILVPSSVWGAATVDQQNAYVLAGKTNLADELAGTFVQYTGNPNDITLNNLRSAGHSKFLVDVHVPGVDTQISAEILQEPDQSYRIIDVINAGVSVVQMKREGFASTAAQGLPNLTSALLKLAQNQPLGSCE